MDLFKLAQQESQLAVKPVLLGENKEKGIGLYIEDQWKALIPCGIISEGDYQNLLRDIREVVRQAIFKALCLQESGSTSSFESGKNEQKTTGGE